MKNSVLVRIVSVAVSLCIAPVVASPERGDLSACREVRFADGLTVRLRAAKIKLVDALLESPGNKIIYAVVIVPPPTYAGNDDREVDRIALAPVTHAHKSARDEEKATSLTTCTKLSLGDGRSRCERPVDGMGLRVSVLFSARASGSLEAATERIAEYVTRAVLDCPQE